MSRHNKVNRDRYTQRGRLTPDEIANESAKQRQVAARRAGDEARGFPRTKPRVTPEDKATHK